MHELDSYLRLGTITQYRTVYIALHMCVLKKIRGVLEF